MKKLLELAIRTLCALAESRAEIRPASVWSRETILAALKESRLGPPVLEKLVALPQAQLETVLRALAEFEPLSPRGETYAFKTSADAKRFAQGAPAREIEMFTECVVNARGIHDGPLGDGTQGEAPTAFVSLSELAAQCGGERVVSALEESYAWIDGALPYDMLTSGISSERVADVLSAAVLKGLTESDVMGIAGPEQSFTGRIARFVVERKRLPSRLVAQLAQENGGTLRGISEGRAVFQFPTEIKAGQMDARIFAEHLEKDHESARPVWEADGRVTVPVGGRKLHGVDEWIVEAMVREGMLPPDVAAKLATTARPLMEDTGGAHRVIENYGGSVKRVGRGKIVVEIPNKFGPNFANTSDFEEDIVDHARIADQRDVRGGVLYTLITERRLTEQDATRPGDGAAEAPQPEGERGGVSREQPETKGGEVAQSQAEPPQEPERPTEHVPDGEEGAPAGDVKLADGTVVPQDVMRQELSKLLSNLATQLQQGTEGGKPQEPVPDEEPGEEEPQEEPGEDEQPPGEAEQASQATQAGAPQPAAQPAQTANAAAGPEAQRRMTEAREDIERMPVSGILDLFDMEPEEAEFYDWNEYRKAMRALPPHLWIHPSNWDAGETVQTSFDGDYKPDATIAWLKKKGWGVSRWHKELRRAGWSDRELKWAVHGKGGTRGWLAYNIAGAKAEGVAEARTSESAQADVDDLANKLLDGRMSAKDAVAALSSSAQLTEGDAEYKFYKGVEDVRRLLSPRSPMGDLRARYKGTLSNIVFLYQYHGPGMSAKLGEAISDLIEDLMSEGFARTAVRAAKRLPHLAALADQEREDKERARLAEANPKDEKKVSVSTRGRVTETLRHVRTQRAMVETLQRWLNSKAFENLLEEYLTGRTPSDVADHLWGVVQGFQMAQGGLAEQLDLGQEDEAAAAAEAIADAAAGLKELRALSFKLATDNTVRMSSLMQAVGAKKSSKAVEKIKTELEGLNDHVAKVAEMLDKANETFKGENGGVGGEQAQPPAEEPPPVEEPPPPPENGAPPANGNGQPAAPPPAPAPAAPPPTPQPVAEALNALVLTDIPSRILECEDYSTIAADIRLRCPRLTARQVVEVYRRIERAERLATARTFSIELTEEDRELLESVSMARDDIPARIVAATVSGAAWISELDLNEAVESLRRYGGLEHRLLADALDRQARQEAGAAS